MRCRYGVWLVMLCCVFPTIASLAEEATFADLLSGKVEPLSVTGKEMGDGWMQLGVEEAGKSESEFLNAIFENDRQVPASTLPFFTRGHVVTCAGKSFLVVYRVPFKIPAALLQSNEEESQPGTKREDEFSPDTRLLMTLIEMKWIKSLQNLLPANPAELYTKTSPTVEQPATGELAVAQRKARQTKATSDLRQLALAALMYAQENEERLPQMTGQRDIEVILKVPAAILHSPVSGQEYRYNYALSGKALGAIRNPTENIIFYDEADNTGKRVAAFVDGHVELLTAERWKQLLAVGRIE